MDLVTFISNLESVSPTSLFLLTLSTLSLLYLYSQHRRLPFPGPLIARYTPLWLYYHSYAGTEATAIHSLHQRHNSPIIRIAPTHLSISNTNSDTHQHNPISQIYVRSNLPKPAFYQNFSFDGFDTLFSTSDAAHRAPRAKAVAPLFAMSRVRESFESGEGARLVDAWVGRLRRRVELFDEDGGEEGAGGFDLLDECRRLPCDVVGGYLFGRPYRALEEDGLLPPSKNVDGETDEGVRLKGKGMTASPFVDSFVAVGQFFLLPNWLFAMILSLMERFYPNETAAQSHVSVDQYVQNLASEANKGQETYQSRLLNAGISLSETKVQMKDVIFAGTDSTGMTLVSLLHSLISHKSWLAELKSSLLNPAPSGEKPLLDATVKEGLRLGMANPVRLSRQVPPHHPFTVLGHEIPPGTILGCASYNLHHDSAAFPDPFTFNPERWVRASEQSSEPPGVKGRLDRMNACMMPFGAGLRQCIARNLASQELYSAVEAVVVSGVLERLEVVGGVEKWEWFNSQVKGRQVAVRVVSKSQ